MPDLLVCDAEGCLRPDDIVRILAVMLWPADGDRRHRFEARVFAEVAARWANHLVIDRAVQLAALDAEPHPLSPHGNASPFASSRQVVQS